MPLYIDIHSFDDGVAADDVAKAHMADLQTQGRIRRRNGQPGP
jgi:hypothetical protein